MKTTQQFIIEKATCGHCVSTIEAAINKNSNVDQANMSLPDKTLTIVSNLTKEQIIEILDAVGFDAVEK